MTRGTIKLIKSGEDDVYFYSHCDGYPAGLLNDIIQIDKEDKVEYWRLWSMLTNQYEEIHSIPGDVDFVYVINMDTRNIYTYDARWEVPSSVGLLRIDSLDTDKLDITDETLRIYK